MLCVVCHCLGYIQVVVVILLSPPLIPNICEAPPKHINFSTKFARFRLQYKDFLSKWRETLRNSILSRERFFLPDRPLHSPSPVVSQFKKKTQKNESVPPHFETTYYNSKQANKLTNQPWLSAGSHLFNLMTNSFFIPPHSLPFPTEKSRKARTSRCG